MDYQKAVKDIQAKRAQISQLTQEIGQAKASAREAIGTERAELQEQLNGLKVAEKELKKA